jgi:hypothetical protein
VQLTDEVVRKYQLNPADRRHMIRMACRHKPVSQCIPTRSPLHEP